MGNDRTCSPVLRVAVDATPLLGQPTGVGLFCGGALRALAARGDVEISTFAVSWRRRRGIEPLVPEGVAVRQRAMPARPLLGTWRHVRLPPVEWFLPPTDVVHGTNFVVPPTRRAARVVSVHDLTPVRFPEMCDEPTRRFPVLVRKALAEGAFVHTHSHFVAKEIVDVLGAAPERVRAVHSGVPELPEPGSAGRAAASRLLPAGTTRYILAVGTFEPRKDLPGLVRAFGELAGSSPGTALVLAGRAGWGVRSVEEAIASSPHPDRIVATGWLDGETVSALQEGASVLAYPSLYEGFGYPPLQAMRAGVPVVASDAGALPEVLGDAAEIVPAGDVQALASSLGRLLEDDGLRKALVDKGRRRVRNFSWESCAAGLADLYRAAYVAQTGG